MVNMNFIEKLAREAKERCADRLKKTKVVCEVPKVDDFGIGARMKRNRGL